MKRIFLIFYTLTVTNILFGQERAFIGATVYMEETNELYTSVVIKEEVDFDFSKIADSSDSIVYDGLELRRKKIPDQIGKMHFEAIEELSIYTLNNQFITDVKFMRWEYYDGMIEGKIIAVYKLSTPMTIDTNDTWNLYGIEKVGSLKVSDRLIANSIGKIDDSNKLLEFLNINESELMFSTEIKFDNLPASYLLLSVGDYRDSEFETLILTKNNNEYTILKQETMEFVIRKVNPTVVESNNHPVFIVEYAKPETDWVWDGIEAYNKDIYVLVKNNLLLID